MRRPSGDRPAPAIDLVTPELVDRCKRGDQSAWNELVRSTHREVYALCLRILRNPNDAAEATQDAYVKAWRGLKGFRGDSLFTTWLYRVATNAAISKQRSLARRRSREVYSEDQAYGEVVSSRDTEAEAGARLELDRLELALADLPEHYRAAVVLRDVYEMSIEEIAQRLGISQTAAKVRVHRARKKLKEAMYPHDGDGGKERS